MTQKKKAPQFATPQGVAAYAYLQRPDTKFNPDGEFKTNLILEAEDLEAPIQHKSEEYNGRSLRDILDEMAEEAYQDALSNVKPQVRKLVTKVEPYAPEYDDEGNETGRYVLKFKLKHKGKSGDREFTQRPMIVDAHKKPTKAEVYGGSIIRCSFSPIPFYVAGTKMAGVTLRLKAVQVIQLESGGGGATAMFEEEDGFTDDGSYGGFNAFDGDDSSGSGSSDDDADY